MKILLCISILALNIFCACNSTNRKSTNSPQVYFEREEDLRKYFINRQNIDLSQDSGEVYVVILQDGFCGACGADIINFLSEHFKGQTLAKKLILSYGKKAEGLAVTWAEIPNLSIMVDEPIKIERSGLRYSKDLLFKFRAGKLVFWSLLESAFLEHTAKKLAKS